jgi:hypothetical protein
MLVRAALVRGYNRTRLHVIRIPKVTEAWLRIDGGYFEPFG